MIVTIWIGTLRLGVLQGSSSPESVLACRLVERAARSMAVIFAHTTPWHKRHIAQLCLHGTSREDVRAGA